MDRWERVRGGMLGVVVFVATLLILFGATAIIGRGAPVDPDAAAAAASAPPASPDPGPSGPDPSGPTPSIAGTSPPGEDPVLVGAGDIADCDSDGDEATAAILDGIAGTVFTAGDNAYENGSTSAFANCYDPSWGRHRDRTWPATGNHDWRSPNLAGYRAYFASAGTGPDGGTWYARDLGTWRVIVLDSQCAEVDGCDAASPQGQWLAAELAATDHRCSVAIFHRPRFSSGDEHGDDPAMDPFWRALYADGVDVVINGHDHDYERFAPQDPDGREDRVRGIRQFVVGTGGRDLRGFREPRPNSELRVSITPGVLALTLHDGSYDWQFHAAEGSTFSDRGTDSCH